MKPLVTRAIPYTEYHTAKELSEQAWVIFALDSEFGSIIRDITHHSWTEAQVSRGHEVRARERGAANPAVNKQAAIHHHGHYVLRDAVCVILRQWFRENRDKWPVPPPNDSALAIWIYHHLAATAGWRW